jgi:hypothetical protein
MYIRESEPPLEDQGKAPKDMQAYKEFDPTCKLFFFSVLQI